VLVYKVSKMVIEELLNGHLGIFARQLRLGIVCRHHESRSDGLENGGLSSFLDDLKDII
jgi:hypothetical protein